MGNGHAWITGDTIIKERANGFLAMPDFVESGLDFSQNGDDIDVANGIAYVGGLRVQYDTGPATIVIPDAQTTFIYLEVQAILASGKLTGVNITGINGYASEQSFVAPNYGILLGTVRKASGTLISESIEETNRGVPVGKGSDLGSTLRTVGETGADYEYLERAILEANDGDTILVREGANLIITQNIVLTDKSLFIVGEKPIDPRQWQTYIAGPTITAPNVTGVLFNLQGSTKLYVKNLSIDYDGQHFLNGVTNGVIDTHLILDHVRLDANDIGVGNYIISCAGSADIMESFISANFTSVGGSGIEVNDASYAEVHIRESTVYARGLGAYALRVVNTPATRVVRSELYMDSTDDTSAAMRMDNGGMFGFQSVFWGASGRCIYQTGGSIGAMDLCILYSSDICIEQIAGSIGVTAHNSLIGNNNPNTIGGTLTELRIPVDSWEGARIADAGGGGGPTSSNTIIVAPSGGDFPDLYSAIVAASNFDTIVCYRGADLLIPTTVLLDTINIRIVTERQPHDPRNQLLPSGTPMIITYGGTPGTNMFEFRNGGGVEFNDFRFTYDFGPTCMCTGGGLAKFHHCQFYIDNGGAPLAAVIESVATFSTDINYFEFIDCDVQLVAGVERFMRTNAPSSDTNIGVVNTQMYMPDFTTLAIGFELWGGGRCRFDGLSILSFGGGISIQDPDNPLTIEFTKDNYIYGESLFALDAQAFTNPVNIGAFGLICYSPGGVDINANGPTVNFSWGEVHCLGTGYSISNLSRLRSPIQDEEYATMGSIAAKIPESGQAQQVIKVGPTPTAFDFTDLDTALLIASGSPGDWTILCWPGADYNIYSNHSWSNKKIEIVSAHQTVDGREQRNIFFSDIAITSSVLVDTPLFTVDGNGTDAGLHLRGVQVTHNLGPLFYSTGGAGLMIDNCKILCTYGGGSPPTYFQTDNTGTTDITTIQVYNTFMILTNVGRLVHAPLSLLNAVRCTFYDSFIFCTPTSPITMFESQHPQFELFSFASLFASDNTSSIFLLLDDGLVNMSAGSYVDVDGGGIFQTGGTVEARSLDIWSVLPQDALQITGGVFNWGEVNVLGGGITDFGVIQRYRETTQTYEFATIQRAQGYSPFRNMGLQTVTVGPNPNAFDYTSLGQALINVIAFPGDWDILCFPEADYTLDYLTWGQFILSSKRVRIINATGAIEPRTFLPTTYMPIQITCSNFPGGALGFVFGLSLDGILEMHGFYFDEQSALSDYYAFELTASTARLHFDRCFVQGHSGLGGLIHIASPGGGRVRISHSQLSDLDAPVATAIHAEEGSILIEDSKIFALEYCVLANGSELTHFELLRSHAESDSTGTSVLEILQGVTYDARIEYSYVRGNGAGCTALFANGPGDFRLLSSKFYALTAAIFNNANNIYIDQASEMINGTIVGPAPLRWRTPSQDWETVSHQEVTKHHFEPVVDPDGQTGKHTRKNLPATTGVGYVEGFAPWDLGSATIIEAVIIAQATNLNFDYDANLEYAGDGQLYNLNAVTLGGSVYSTTLNNIHYLDVTPMFAGIAADEMYGFEFLNIDATDAVYFVGLRFRYRQ